MFEEDAVVDWEAMRHVQHETSHLREHWDLISLSLISAITTGASAATTARIGRCVSGAYIGFYRARASLWARSTRGRARAASCRALSGSGIALLCLERRLDRSADEAS